MVTYLYEIKIRDNEGDEVKTYDVIANSPTSAIIKAEDLVREDIEKGDLSEEYTPHRVSSIVEDRTIDA